MSRRLPLCAVCGGTLAGKARTILEYGSLPSHPSIGWHWAESGSCMKDDDAKNSMWARLKVGPVEPILAEIEARGPGRVVRDRSRSARGLQP